MPVYRDDRSAPVLPLLRAFVGRVWYETAPATSHHVRQAVARERDVVCASERTHHRGCESLTD